jgi:hypothetical protein
MMGGDDGSNGFCLAVNFLAMPKAHGPNEITLGQVNGSPKATNITIDFNPIDIHVMAAAVFVITHHSQGNLGLQTGYQEDHKHQT